MQHQPGRHRESQAEHGQAVHALLYKLQAPAKTPSTGGDHAEVGFAVIAGRPRENSTRER